MNFTKFPGGGTAIAFLFRFFFRNLTAKISREIGYNMATLVFTDIDIKLDL